jgi:hypothetical protein
MRAAIRPYRRRRNDDDHREDHCQPLHCLHIDFTSHRLHPEALEKRNVNLGDIQ